MLRLNQLPILTILSGVFFVLAGVFAYLGVSLYYLAPAIFVIGGATVILLALAHQRTTGGSIALFILSLIVFTSVGGAYGGSQTTSFSAPRAKVPVQVFDLRVTADFGSIRVSFTNRTDIAYRVNFTRSFFGFDYFGGRASQLSNSTTGSTFTLNVYSPSSRVDVVLGRGYATNITSRTSTGSIDLMVPSGLQLEDVDLSAGTGSIRATIGASTLGGIRLGTSTGSVDLTAQSTVPSGRLVPVTVSTSTGSVSLRMVLPGGVPASLRASTGTGSLTRNLIGFTISQETRGTLQATAGDPSGASPSFVIVATAGTGSVDITATASG